MFILKPLPVASGILVVSYLFMARVATAETFLQDDWFNLENKPLITAITPTRIQKSALEQPVAVTVLDRDFIQSTGANEIAELLAFVPGMARGFRANREQSLAYHGLSSVNPKRMQVLIDGMSVYEAGLSKVDWRHIPLTVDQIERIEITRSPSAAVYGANSFSGIINFISRKVSEQDKAVMSAYRSTDETTKLAMAMKFELKEHVFSVHYQYQAEHGFKNYDDNSQQHRVKLQHYVTGENWQSNTQVSYVEDDFGGDHPDEVDLSSSESQDVYIQNQSNWQINNNLELKLNQYYYKKHTQDNWQACFHPSFLSTEFGLLYQEDPTLIAALLSGQISIEQVTQLSPVAQAAIMNFLSYGGVQATSICGASENFVDQIRKQIELQASWIASDQLKLVVGGYWRQDELNSNVYLKPDNWESFDSFVSFANIEYRATDKWVFDLAVMNESHEKSSDSLSPRVAVNYQACDNCSLRLNYSYTERKPGEFEQNGQFRYFIKDIEANPYQIEQGYYFLSSSAQNQLTSEKMKAVELGYHFNSWSTGIDLDVNLFHQQMTDLINQGIRIEEFIYENDLNVDLTGLETELNWQINQANFVKFNWTQLNWQLKQAKLTNQGLYSPASSVALFYSHQAQNWQTGLGGLYSDVKEAGTLTQLQAYLRKPVSLYNHKLILGLNTYYQTGQSKKRYQLSEFESRWLISLKAELIW
ncbi:TonB-dependent receptor [Catenovulum sp. 2E275]|uniref:TonB-dependent receptor plug domain-containing protein n=1 Tax=Catenovulum sp. 2E275 TaxID=2980497 RepID=UPI0021D2D5BD|nr:TonB-dependent receptor [Catenovulum sp. 2E275]MCU4677125.1 TonB-dependent receptor [Catenovulum sp. 2E275]